MGSGPRCCCSIRHDGDGSLSWSALAHLPATPSGIQGVARVMVIAETPLNRGRGTPLAGVQCLVDSHVPGAGFRRRELPGVMPASLRERALGLLLLCSVWSLWWVRRPLGVARSGSPWSKAAAVAIFWPAWAKSGGPHRPRGSSSLRRGWRRVRIHHSYGDRSRARARPAPALAGVALP